MKLTSYCAAFLLSVTTQIVNAEVYHWTDAEGTVHYSDQAPKDTPDLQPEKIIIPTHIETTKLPQKAVTTLVPKKAQKAAETGPTVIVIDSKDSGANCTSQKINSVDRPNAIIDYWQDAEWKRCHGMQ